MATTSCSRGGYAIRRFFLYNHSKGMRMSVCSSPLLCARVCVCMPMTTMTTTTTTMMMLADNKKCCPIPCATINLVLNNAPKQTNKQTTCCTLCFVCVPLILHSVPLYPYAALLLILSLILVQAQQQTKTGSATFTSPTLALLLNAFFFFSALFPYPKFA